MTVHVELPAVLDAFLVGAADGIDAGTENSENVIPALAASGLAGAGVPVSRGGTGGDVADGVAAIAAIAERSLAAAFMLWGHRAYIEYLLQSPNHELAERQLPDLLAGKIGGATGLSNAMKFLAGLEPLQIKARTAGASLVLEGKMPWVTNLRPAGFHVAAAVDREDGGSAFVASVSLDDHGIERSPDLELMSMRSSDTAAITLSNVRIGADRIIAEDAKQWLPKVRPAFLGLQCGMSIGLARRALEEARYAAGAGRSVLAEPIASLGRQLDHAQSRLNAGLRSRAFETDAPTLFELRIELAEIVADAVQLELQAAGGRAYLAGPGKDFARRWREAAFIPVITPSLVQLKTVLAARRQAA